MTARAKGGLGRGLTALLEEMGPAPSGPREEGGTNLLAISMIDANPRQPRRQFDDVQMAELADSIRVKGILQPILVRPKPGGRYEIVAGERRWRASQMAGVHEIPAVVRPFSEADGFEAAIIENVQRADLNLMEEALGYQRLIRDFAHTQDMVAAATGKSRSHVANLLRLLELPEDAQSLVRMGLLSLGHAKAILQAKNPGALAKEVAARGLTVRQAEEAARRSHEAPRKRSQMTPAQRRNADLEALEAHLSELLGLQVTIEARGKRGTVTIKYSDLDQLDVIVGRLQG